MGKKIKVFVTSCEILEGKRGVEEKLKECYEKSDKKYELINDAELADIILIAEERTENREEKLIENRFFISYPSKCFALTYVDRPLILNHGIYSSCEKSIMRNNRIRTGSYTLYSDKFRNPFIETDNSPGTNTIEKLYLFSFIGRNSHPIREKLFQQKFVRQDIYIEDSSNFNLYKSNSKEMIERQKHYFEILSFSKFSICPRGWGTSSIRLFESMELGIAPIIISDDWIPPKGPKWEYFSLRIKEKYVKDLEKIIIPLESSYEEMGNLASREYEKYFSEHIYFNYVVDNCLEIQDKQIIPENIYMFIDPLYLFFSKFKDKFEIKDRIKRRLRILTEFLKTKTSFK
jgi:hypothetical protein